MKISAALARALRAVEANEVARVSDGRKSVLQGPRGVGAKTLWLAKMNGFIKDGPDMRVGRNTKTGQILTDAGLVALSVTSPNQKGQSNGRR